MRKTMLTAGVIVTAALVMSGCSDATGAASGGTGTQTVLSVVGWKGAGTNVADMPALNSAFEKANPGIKLDYKYVDNANYETYNNPRFAGGSAADVIMLDRPKMLNWQKQGYLMDLSDQPWVKRLEPALAPFNQVAGKTYQLNCESIPIGLYANLDLLKANGISSVPTTWPDFLAALNVLKAKGVNGLIMPNKGGWAGTQLALLLAANHIPADWPAQYDAGKTKFQDWAPVIDSYKALFGAKLVDPQLSLGLDANVDGTPQFVAGKWAFMVQGAWALNSLAQDTKFAFTLNPFPGGPAGSQPKAFVFIGTGWGINAKAKSAAAAKKYIDFMSQPANAKVYLAAESAFSTLTDVSSPAVPQAAPMAAAQKAGNLVPSASESLNATDGEAKISDGLVALFQKPTSSTQSVLDLLSSTVTPTPLG